MDEGLECNKMIQRHMELHILCFIYITRHIYYPNFSQNAEFVEVLEIGIGLYERDEMLRKVRIVSST